MKKKLLITFAVLFVLGLASIPLLYPVAKAVRSQQHLSSAIELKAAGEDRTAYFKIQSAYNLAPGNEEILSVLGPYAADVRHPDTLRWWMQAADQGLLLHEDLIAMVEYGFASGNREAVRPYLFRLFQEFPGDARVQSLQLRFLQAARQDFQAFLLARKMIEAGNRDESVLAAYVRGAFTLDRLPREDRDKALGTLWSITGEEGAASLYAIRVLFQFWNTFEISEQEQLQVRLLEHPGHTFADRLLLLSLLRNSEREAPETILAEAETVFAEVAASSSDAPASAGEDLAVFTDWLNREGFPEAALRYLEDPLTSEDSRLFYNRQIALIALGEADRAYELSLEQNALSPARNLVLRAMAQERLGQRDDLSQTLSLAAESVEGKEIAWLEQVLQRSGERDLVIRMFEKLEETMSNPLPARLRLLNYYYASGREADISRLLREMESTSLDSTLPERTPLLYFQLLFRRDAEETRRAVESLVLEMPMMADFRVLLAFSYAIGGEAEAASELVTELGEIDASQQRVLNIMLAYVHLANNETDKARERMESIERESLLPQERVLLSRII